MHILTVLLHPWHGVLIYHPLYAFLLAAALVRLRVGSPSADDRLAWAALLLAALASLMIQAAWYCWWMGTGTFGGRQLAIWSVLFLPPWIALLAKQGGGARLRSTLLWLLSVGTAGWGYLLLGGGETNFRSYRDFVLGAGALLRANVMEDKWNLAAACLAAISAGLFVGRDQRGRRVAIVALWSLIVTYLFRHNAWLSANDDGHRILLWKTLEVATILLIPLAIHQASAREQALGVVSILLVKGSQVATVAAFCLVTGLFVRLWLGTPAVPLMARGECYGYRASFDLPEVEQSLAEHERVAGSEADKRRLRTFMENAEPLYRTRSTAHFRLRTTGVGPQQQTCLARFGVLLRAWRE